MELEKIPHRRRHIYLCPSVEQREELFRKFTQAVVDSDVVISRWRDLPHKVDDILCVVSDDSTSDVRCNKLQAHGIESVGSAWIKECIAQAQIVPLPSQKLSAMIPNNNYNVMRAGTSEWTEAEDGVIRAVREARLRGEEDKQKGLELLLLQRRRTLVEMHNRECVLFGEPPWGEKDDAIVLQIHHFKGNSKRIAQLEKSFQPKRTSQEVRCRLRCLGF